MLRMLCSLGLTVVLTLLAIVRWSGVTLLHYAFVNFEQIDKLQAPARITIFRTQRGTKENVDKSGLEMVIRRRPVTYSNTEMTDIIEFTESTNKYQIQLYLSIESLQLSLHVSCQRS